MCETGPDEPIWVIILGFGENSPQKDLTNRVVSFTMPDEVMKMTPTEVKDLRKSLNMTQQELANVIGVDRVTVANWETGRKRPSPLAQRQLARLNRKATVNRSG